ncbi:MAG: hypothetical protein AB7O65_10070 [Candidatus Korobacteraceae bacterium]
MPLVVQQEFQKLKVTITNGIVKELERLDLSLHALVSSGRYPAHSSLQRQLLPVIAALHDDLLSTCLVIDSDPACELRARMRIAAADPPAGKGGKNSADARIFDHCLGLCRTLRSSGFKERCFFISSNKRDYGPIPYGKGCLPAELSAVALEYENSFDSVASALKL